MSSMTQRLQSALEEEEVLKSLNDQLARLEEVGTNDPHDLAFALTVAAAKAMQLAIVRDDNAPFWAHEMQQLVRWYNSQGTYGFPAREVGMIICIDCGFYVPPDEDRCELCDSEIEGSP